MHVRVSESVYVMYVYMSMSMYACNYVCMLYVVTCMYVCNYQCDVCIYMSMSMYVCMYVHVYLLNDLFHMLHRVLDGR